MTFRSATLLLAVILALGAGGVAMWHRSETPMPPDVPEAMQDDLPPPIPPIPPRIAEGSDYDTCLNMVTTDPDAALRFAETWQAKGGGAAATHCLGLATSAQGEPAQGAAILEALAASPASTQLARATILAQAAQSRLAADDAPAAIADDTSAIALAPDTVDTWLDRAIADLSLERFEDAIDDLTQALDLDPKRPDAWHLRATAWRGLGRWELAEDDIARSMELDPDEPDALLERGILRQHAKNLRGARADWRRVMQLAPDTPSADLAQQDLELLDAGPSR